MDVQLKRGLLEACVLADLAKGDSYAYQTSGCFVLCGMVCACPLLHAQRHKNNE